MKTFEYLKQERLCIEKTKLAKAKEIRENYANNTFEQNFDAFEQIKNSQKAIENLDEAVRIEIAMYANLLHDELRSSSNLSTFSEVFQKYIYCVEKIFTDGNIYISNPELPPLYNYKISKAILYLGFTQNDFQQLNDNNIDFVNKNEFLAFINNFYNVNIPLSDEWREHFQQSMPECLLEKIEQRCRYELLMLRNGQYLYKGYPLRYEADILGDFDSYPESIKSQYVKKLTQSKK